MITEDETRRYFAKFQNGDIDAKNIIAKEHLNLVYHIVNKFSNVDHIDKDDLISLGYIGYVKAINSFNLTKNNKFATYACTCILNEIKMELRKNRINTINIDNNILKNLKCDKADKYVYELEDNQLHEFIINYINTLDEIDQKIIKLYFGLEDNDRYTQREITKKLNLSSQGLTSKKIKKILNNIKNHLDENAYIFKDDDKSLIKK